MLYGEKMKMILDKFGIDTSTLPDKLYSTLLDEIYNSNASGVDNNRFYMVKDTKRLYDKLALWGYGGFRGNGYIKDEYVIKKVTKTIEDINNGFKGAYVTLKIDLTDVSVGAILLESCKCCTTILDFWLE